MRSECWVYYLKLLLQLLDYDQIVQVFCSKLGLSLLLTGDLLLLQFLHFKFELVEVQRAFFFCSVQLFAVELLKTAILFNSLLQVSFVLCRDVLDLFVEPFDLYVGNS